MVKLPTWEDCDQKLNEYSRKIMNNIHLNSVEIPTPLEIFIRNNEPSLPAQCKAFRRELIELIKYFEEK